MTNAAYREPTVWREPTVEELQAAQQARRRHGCWHGPGPYPLEWLPLDYQREIAWAVAQPTPPARWLKFELCEIPSRAWSEWYRQRGMRPDTREKIPASLRAAVLERDGHVCQLCGGDVEPSDVHLDHRHPRALGGRDTLGNLQVAHSRCNMSKGIRLL